MNDSIFSEQIENRKQLIRLFESIRSVSEKCAPFYDEFIRLEEEKKQLKAEVRSYAAVISSILGLIAIVAGITVLREEVFVGIILFVVSIALFGFSFNRIKNLEKVRKQAESKAGAIQAQQEKLLDTIDEIYNGSDIAGLYPQKYLFPDAVNFCQTMIEDMRADSIKEAINLYEDTMYKEQMAALQHSMEVAQRNMAETLQSMEDETSRARKAAQFAAFAAWISATRPRN